MFAMGKDSVLNMVKLGMNCDSAGCGKNIATGFVEADGNAQLLTLFPQRIVVRIAPFAAVHMVRPHQDASKSSSFTTRRVSSTAEETSCGATMAAPYMRSGATLQKSCIQSL